MRYQINCIPMLCVFLFLLERKPIILTKRKSIAAIEEHVYDWTEEDVLSTGVIIIKSGFTFTLRNISVKRSLHNESKN